MSKIKRFFVGMFRAFNDDNITDVAAMMAYYTAFALFPMLVFIVTLTLLVLPADVLHDGVAMMSAAMPHALGDLFTQQVDRMAKAASSGFAIGGAALALWSASRGAASLSGALNRMFQKKETRGWIKRQLIALAITFVVALLVVVALGLLLVVPMIADLGDVFTIGRWFVAGLIVMFVWALMYKFLPDTDAPFRVFTPGATIGVLLWLGVSYLFGLYVSYHDTYEATYGTLGGAILFLTWLWMSNLALLLGAEINDVLADLRKHVDADAAALAHPETPPQHGNDNDVSHRVAASTASTPPPVRAHPRSH